MDTEQKNYELSAAELERTRPDYRVFVPRDMTSEGLNEHFIVFEGGDGNLKAVWTQSDMSSGLPDYRQVNRIMFAESSDQGETWSSPRRVVGPRDRNDSSCQMTSWAFPMVTDRGRIYVLYSQHIGKTGWCPMHTGVMRGLFSDDQGQTWSAPENIPFEWNRHDDPDRESPPEWIVWQLPMKDLRGGFLAPYTRWVNKKVAAISPEAIVERLSTIQMDEPETDSLWTWWESVSEVMRFTNLQDHPAVKDIAISYSAWDDKALRVPHYLYPECSVAQEPSIVRLPDDRIFCVMRTNSGYLWYSLSADNGDTWCAPRPLLYRDYGRPILNPVGCAPIYPLSDGSYALFHSNNRGTINPPAEYGPRNPVFISYGEYRPDADQPLWFSDPVKFMDVECMNVYGRKGGNNGLSLYGSHTRNAGRDVLWYPDRKCALFGKIIPLKS